MIIMQKPLFLLLFLTAATLFVGCGGERTPQEEVKESFMGAMDALNNRRFDEYIDCVDFGCELDSIQKDVFVKTYSQYLERVQHYKGSLQKLEVVDVAFSSDSVCDVYYETLYSDSIAEQHSQKMVRIGDTWKIKARN